MEHNGTEEIRRQRFERLAYEGHLRDIGEYGPELVEPLAEGVTPERCPQCGAIDDDPHHKCPTVTGDDFLRDISEFSFSEFQSMSAERSRKAFPTCGDWTLNDWAVALSGEVGELCNLLKKDRRGLATDERYDLDGPFKESARQAVIEELADVITYADLMLSELGADTGEAVLTKFNEVSRRIGWPPTRESPR